MITDDHRCMPRLTVTFDADLYEWIEAEADRRDRPKAWIVTQAVATAREGEGDGDRLTGDHHTGDHRTDDHRTDDHHTDELRETVAELAERVADLEAAVRDERAGGGGAGGPETGASRSAQAGSDAREGDGSAGSDGPADAGAGGDGFPPDVWAAVREASESWADSDDRLRRRREAAAAVVEHAVTTGDAVGKSDAVDRFADEYDVPGQSDETWWRKNVRPVLAELGDYSQGAHGYTVTLGE